jgi:K+:H+ antiporter
MIDAPALQTLLPIIVLLLLGVAAAIGSRAVGLSPIVGYIVLGFVLRISGVGNAFDTGTIALLAELGVVFLLFDIGLHFSVRHIREHASDIFAFGPVQVFFASVVLGLLALPFGLSWTGAALVGVTLALSSTAIVARLIAERHQQSCPVGLTATAILVFQDVAAILLLVVVGALDGGGPIAPAIALAVSKAGLAFGVTVALARLVIGPVFSLIASSKNEEVFTASTLLIALAAGWITGNIGLSLTLGAFLGGVTISETPYRALIQAEIAPFRGLLLGFFFIFVGFSIDADVLAHDWLAALGLAVGFVAVKVLTNIAASRMFHWSVPGSTQLGFLLSQGSEFAFVILSLPVVKSILGESRASVLVASVALSIAATPHLAEFGRKFAGALRRRMEKPAQSELTPRDLSAPVIIVGMGRIGRTVADALIEFQIDYVGIERDQQRLNEAIADGYEAEFGDGGTIRLWESMELHRRKVSVLTAPDPEAQLLLSPLIRSGFPDLERFAVITDASQRDHFRALGLHVVVEHGDPPGVDAASAVLRELGKDEMAISEWRRRQDARGRTAAALPIPATA